MVDNNIDDIDVSLMFELVKKMKKDIEQRKLYTSLEQKEMVLKASFLFPLTLEEIEAENIISKYLLAC